MRRPTKQSLALGGAVLVALALALAAPRLLSSRSTTTT